MMRDWLTKLLQIKNADEDTQRRGRNAIIISLGLIGIALVSTPVLSILQASIFTGMLYTLIPALFTLGVIVIIRHGYVNAGALISISLQILPMLISVFFIETTKATIFLLIMPVVFASLTMSPRYILFILALVLGGTLVVISTSPLYSLSDVGLVSRLIQQALLGICLGSIGFISAQATQAALLKAQAGREQAEQASQALTASKIQLEQMVYKRSSELQGSMHTLEQHEKRLQTVLEELHQNQRIYQELAIPLLPILPGTIAAVIVGHLEEQQANTFVQQLLYVIEHEHIRMVICDLTGVPTISAPVAQRLLQLVESSNLLGADFALVGIRPEVADLVASFDLDFAKLQIFADLQHAVVTLAQ